VQAPSVVNCNPISKLISFVRRFCATSVPDGKIIEVM